MLLTLTAALVLPLAAAGRPDCPANPGIYDTRAAAAAAPLKRLDRLPPASHVLTLFRAVDGCAEPVVLRAGIGSAGER